MQISRKVSSIIWAWFILIANAPQVFTLIHRGAEPKILSELINLGEDNLLNMDLNPAIMQDDDDALNSRCDRRGQSFIRYRPSAAASATASSKGDAKSPAQFLTSLRSEDEIAARGQMTGVKPVHYDLLYDATDLSRFEGSAAIRIQVIAETRLVALHADTTCLKIDPESISINLWTSNDQESVNNTGLAGPEICIRRMWAVNADQLIILELKQKLKTGQFYQIKFGRFSGTLKMSGPNSREGLLRTTSEFNSHWTTVFEMRFARTAFPCFDHPSLKATFKICIKHQNSTVALSAMPLESSKIFGEVSSIGNEILIDCFETTPLIPTYTFSFAILDNYSKISDPAPGPQSSEIDIEVYYSDENNNITSKNDSSSDFRWQIDWARRTLEYMRTEFGLETNLSKLTFLNLNDLTYWGVENLGLITVQASKMAEDPLNKLIIIHEIVHHWLGNVVTISRWDEICLQEALTSYFDKYLAEKLNANVSFARHVRTSVEFAFKKGADARAPVGKFGQTPEIVERCYVHPVSVLYSISRAFGQNLLNHFLITLVDRYKYSNANLRQWVDLLDELYNATYPEKSIIDLSIDNDDSNSSSRLITPGQFLESWFVNDGYPISFIKLISDNDNDNDNETRGQNTLISVTQRIYWPRNRSIIGRAPFRPLFYDVLSPDFGNESLLIDRIDYSVRIDRNPAWILMDPNRLTYSRQIYSPEIYLSVMSCFWHTANSTGPQCPISLSHLGQVLVDLCCAFSRRGRYDEEMTMEFWMRSFPAESWNRVVELATEIISKYPSISLFWYPFCYYC